MEVAEKTYYYYYFYEIMKVVLEIFTLVVVVVCIFRYLHLYLQKSIKKKEEGRSGTTGTGVSQKDLQRGAKRTNKKNVIEKERCAMQAGSGGHIRKVGKQLGLNL